MRNLKGVRFVAQVRRSLISLEVMGSLWYYVRIEKEIIKVIIASLVALKLNKVNRLYILLGSVRNNRGTCASIQDEDQAILWINRLGHVHENG